MNPFLLETTNRIIQHFPEWDLSEDDKRIIAIEVGSAILEVLKAKRTNPDLNFNGCGYINENTMGVTTQSNH